MRRCSNAVLICVITTGFMFSLGADGVLSGPGCLLVQKIKCLYPTEKQSGAHNTAALSVGQTRL